MSLTPIAAECKCRKAACLHCHGNFKASSLEEALRADPALDPVVGPFSNLKLKSYDEESSTWYLVPKLKTDADVASETEDARTLRNMNDGGPGSSLEPGPIPGQAPSPSQVVPDPSTSAASSDIATSRNSPDDNHSGLQLQDFGGHQQHEDVEASDAETGGLSLSGISAKTWGTRSVVSVGSIDAAAGYGLGRTPEGEREALRETGGWIDGTPMSASLNIDFPFTI